MIKIDDYHNALEIVLDKIDTFPSHLKPSVIYQAGNVKNPGISDLDLLIGFDDDFCFGSEFLHQFSNFVKNIKNNDIFFLHMPYMYSISQLKKLPLFSFNSTKDLSCLFGKTVFEEEIDISPSQIILKSFEFIHSRIIDLLTQIYTKQMNWKNILVIGHSLIHSADALKRVNKNIKINMNNFKTFCKIENFRQNISLNKNVNINNQECEELYKGICLEFNFLLQLFKKEINRKIASHWCHDFLNYEYSHNVFLRNLHHKRNDLHINYNNDFFEIYGFTWELKAISDNYFKNEDEFTTIFFEDKFQNEIDERKNFLKSIFEFNFINFGNAQGRGSFRPYALGKTLDYLFTRM